MEDLSRIYLNVSVVNPSLAFSKILLLEDDLINVSSTVLQFQRAGAYVYKLGE